MIRYETDSNVKLKGSDMTINTAKTETDYDEEYELVSLEMKKLYSEPFDLFMCLSKTEKKEVMDLIYAENSRVSPLPRIYKGFNVDDADSRLALAAKAREYENKDALAGLKTLKSVLYPFMRAKIERVLK